MDPDPDGSWQLTAADRQWGRAHVKWVPGAWSCSPLHRQHTAMRKDLALCNSNSKKCHPSCCRLVFIFRVESTGMAALSRAAELLALYPISNQIFAKRATGCLSAVQSPVSTTPLALEPNLRTILDPAGVLRGQSLATTTKTHRQLAVFPNSHALDPK